MRIWLRARIARVAIAMIACAIVFAAVGTSGLRGANARVDALPAPFEKTDTVMTAIESTLAHGEALSLRAPAFSAERSCSDRASTGPVRQSGAQLTQERRYFYDDACTSLARVETIDSRNGRLVVTATTYGRSGLALAQRTTEYGPQSRSAASRLTQGSGSSVIALANVSWATRPGGAQTASIARVGDPQHASIGVVETVDVKTGDGTLRGASQGSAYRSAAGGLAVSMDAPYRVIAADSSKIDDGASSWSARLDRNGLPQSLAVRGTRRVDGLSLEVRTVDGRFAGRIDGADGSVLAEFNLDRLGDGLVRFAGGETGTIADWHILG
jgi:hypothetical protein